MTGLSIMLSKVLKAVAFSDVHTGHKTTPTANIITRLKEHVNSLLEDKPDFIFIPGDFFDHLLTLPEDGTKLIQSFIAWLLQFCKLHDIKLRVLEGTPSHDWKQNYLFMQINHDNQINADVRYYDKLAIDYEESHNLYVLYVPDELDESTSVTLAEVRELLAAKGLQSVDLAIMHGMFEFQVPSHLQDRLPLHSQAEYESFVNYLIVIGHDHVHKRNGKVIVPGSFDRLRHNEEEPKGYIRFTITPKGKVNTVFIENTEAERYVTLDLTNLTVEEALLHIDDTIKSLPQYAKVRLRYPENHPIAEHLSELTRTYSDVVWSKSKVDKEDRPNTVTVSDVLSHQYTAIVLNRDTLHDKLMQELSEQYEEVDTALASQLLQETLNHV